MAVIDGAWKLVSFDNQASFQLYNLVEDPSEKTDIAAAHPEVVSRLRAEFGQWRRGIDESRNAAAPAGTH